MRMLPVYFLLASAALAQRPPSLMEEVGRDNLPAQRLGIDDLVAVSVYDAPELTRSVRVEQDGAIWLPLLKGGVKAASLFPRDLETSIAEALKAKDVTGETAADALAENPVDDVAALEALWRRRFGQAPADDREKARQVRFLQSRGFALSAIFKLLRNPPAADE